jgi:two-component system chemotaxis response regulator CheB
MPNRDLVVIGASAGGIWALQQLCGALPEDLNAVMLAVVHTAASSSSLLSRVLRRAGCLNAVSPSDGEEIKKGTVYVEPPDRHMIVEGHHLMLVRGSREIIIVRQSTRRFVPQPSLVAPGSSELCSPDVWTTVPAA